MHRTRKPEHVQQVRTRHILHPHTLMRERFDTTIPLHIERHRPLHRRLPLPNVCVGFDELLIRLPFLRHILIIEKVDTDHRVDRVQRMPDKMQLVAGHPIQKRGSHPRRIPPQKRVSRIPARCEHFLMPTPHTTEQHHRRKKPRPTPARTSNDEPMRFNIPEILVLINNPGFHMPELDRRVHKNRKPQAPSPKTERHILPDSVPVQGCLLKPLPRCRILLSHPHKHRPMDKQTRRAGRVNFDDLV